MKLTTSVRYLVLGMLGGAVAVQANSDEQAFLSDVGTVPGSESKKRDWVEVLWNLEINQ